MSRTIRAAACLHVVLLLVAGRVDAADRPGGRGASNAIADLVGGYRARTGAAVGAHVVRLRDGAVLCDVSSSAPLIPASNQKILTAAVARKRLGEDFRFRTVLARAGDDLVVIGDGDPTTGDPRLARERNETVYAALDRWAATLADSGVMQVGNLLVRTGIFQPPHAHPDWPEAQRQRWYAAPVSGVNFHDNCFDIGFEVRGKEVRPVVSPMSRLLDVDSRVKLGRRHLWSCRFGGAGARLSLRGTVTRTTPDPYPVAAPDPGVLFGCVLADRLARAGVAVKGKVLTSTDPAWSRPAPGGRRVLLVETTPISVAMRRANKQSLNMMAECLFLRSGVEAGAPADWQSAARRARAVLCEQYRLDPEQFAVADGSGLSRRNRASPAVLTALLRALADWPEFLRSLAVGGVDGSLRRRLKEPAARGRVLGKTGSLIGVSALSGYVLDGAGRPAVAFSVLTNGRTRARGCSAKALEDGICRALIRAADAR